MKIAMKPGKPLSIGRLRNAVFIGLLGNPDAAFTTWKIIGAHITATAAGLQAPDLQRPLESAHYCSHDYQKILRQHSFEVSMSSGKGNFYDCVETFFKTIKAELIWRNRWEKRGHAEGAIFQYINGFYKPRRRHSSLGGKIPLAFERKAA